VDRDRAVESTEHRGHGGAARAGARRHRLPHSPLEDPCGYLAIAVAAPERHVRAVREQLTRLDRRAELGQVEALELVTRLHLDRALRVADGDVLEAQLANGDRQGAGPVRGPGRVVLRGAA